MPSVLIRNARILKHTAQAFFADRISQLGAALAFYTTIAVAPLLVLAIAVAGVVFEEDEARNRVLQEIDQLAGARVAKVVEEVKPPEEAPQGESVTILSAVTLVFGAFGVFYHLQDALNTIWRVSTPEGITRRQWIFRRLFSLATVIGTGFLLLVSLIASAALSWLGSQTVAFFGGPAILLQTVNTALSLGMTTLLFAIVFKFLPDTPVHWRQVWRGAIVTALLFTVGKSALGAYLGRASVTSGYGAAGSLLVLLLWSYYAAQIVFLGAQFTRITALSRGGRDFSTLNDPARQPKPA